MTQGTLPGLASPALDSLTHAEVTDLFLDGSLPDSAFTHRDHVRVGWELLGRYDLGAALQRMTDGVRTLAAQRGLPDLYSATITTLYMLALAHARAEQSPDSSFEELESSHPELPSNAREFLLGSYDESTLDGRLARATFVMPDRWHGGT